MLETRICFADQSCVFNTFDYQHKRVPLTLNSNATNHSLVSPAHTNAGVYQHHHRIQLNQRTQSLQAIKDTTNGSPSNQEHAAYVCHFADSLEMSPCSNNFTILIWICVLWPMKCNYILDIIGQCLNGDKDWYK